ncbi:MAG: M42 family peptidase, partial [Pirellulales bacterium]
QVLVGQRMTVWTASGPLPAVIGRKPIHLLTEDERKQVPKLKDLWLDIAAKDKTDAERQVHVGDPVTLELGYRPLANNLACSPAMDNKCGLWVVLEALRRADRKKLDCALYAVSTVQEEVGLRGAATSAFGIEAQVGIAVDVTHATDCPTIDKKQEGDVKVGGGPVIYRGPNMNPRVVERLIAAATVASIPYQVAASGRATGTDANAMLVNRAGMATALVS